MGRERWVGLNTTQILPGSVAQIPEVLDTVTKAVDETLKAVADVAKRVDKFNSYLNSPDVVLAKAAITAAKEALLEMSGSVGNAGLHMLAVPMAPIAFTPVKPILPFTKSTTVMEIPGVVGSGGNLGFYNTVQSSIYDPLDPYKPKYGTDDYVAGLVILAGADAFGQLTAALQYLSRLTGSLAQGLDANVLPHPTDVQVRLVPGSKGGTAVEVSWAPALLVGRPEYGIGAYRIRRANIYRSWQPIEPDTMQEALEDMWVDQVAYNPLAVHYIDETVEPGKTYYYAVTFSLEVVDLLGGVSVVSRETMSSAHRIAVTPLGQDAAVLVPSSRGTPPDWRGLPTTIALIPKLQRFMGRVAAYLETLEKAIATTDSAVARLAAGLHAAIQQRTATIQAIIALLDELKSALMPPPAGIHAMSFYGRGGNNFILGSIYEGLNDQSDPARPPFDTGQELVAGLVFVAGAGSANDLAGVRAFFDLLASPSSPPAYSPEQSAAVSLDAGGKPEFSGGTPPPSKPFSDECNEV